MSKKILFKNIGGYEYQKEEAEKISDFFKDYKRYIDGGAVLPHGIIFYGVSGTGKTMLAQAIINESGATTFTLLAEDFEKSRTISAAVKKVFDRAIENEPSIVMIDEIDRLVYIDMPLSQETDIQRETLRALLVQIDRINKKNVLVIATANSELDRMPSALLRAGRIEKHVFLNEPSKEERLEIIKLYLSKNDYFSEINPVDVTSYTMGFTGSDIATLTNEVLIKCIKYDRKATFSDFLDPIECIKCNGIQRKTKINNSLIKYHEIGHFVVDYVLNGTIGMINTKAFGNTDGLYSNIDKFGGYFGGTMTNEEFVPEDREDSLKVRHNKCVVAVAGFVCQRK